MNIIIPLGGRGERFLKNGYTDPKPLIRIFEKCMIEYALDCLRLTSEDRVFIIYHERLDAHQFASRIRQTHPFVQFISIREDTKGATETLYLGIPQIIHRPDYNNQPPHKKCLVIDCDTFYTEDIVCLFRESNDNVVFYTKNRELAPIYSYIKVDQVESTILEIREKVKISDNANTGAYGFTDIFTLYEYCRAVLDKGITFNGEPYTSCVISEMIKDGHIFKGMELDTSRVFSLGTPDAVADYIKKTKAYLFDLDGTLVITENIYYHVWSEILATYNISLSDILFTKFIQGNNDRYVLNTLLVNVELSLSELSEWKDRLFLQHIDKLLMVEGVADVIFQIKCGGHKLCIVSNCNERTARAILEHFDIYSQFDFILSSDDFQGAQKSYKVAAEKYGIDKHNCFIFEDSKTGILCGKQFGPKLLVGVETIYNAHELKKYGADISISDFTELDINRLGSKDTDSLRLLHNSLLESLLFTKIRDVMIDESMLKGGFIADVVKARIYANDGEEYDVVIKCENNREQNNLSLMANRIRMYEREYYFYEHIANKVNIRIPQFYGFVIGEQQKRTGVVLENMFERSGFNINLNLNVESIDVALKVVDRMAKMHGLFWGKSLKHEFPGLYSYSDDVFSPFLSDFVSERREVFESKWFNALNPEQRVKCAAIFDSYPEIQRRFSVGKHLTFIHGDIKSPNIFYDTKNDNDPMFIDWQHCAIGKGVQDLVFFVLESFDITKIRAAFQLMRQYYYVKLLEYGVVDYSEEEYERDLQDAMQFIPFFTSVWFGTTPQDELIDKNFPYFLITKLFYLLTSIGKE